MKSVFIFFISILVLTSCEPNYKKSVENYTDGKVSKVCLIDTTDGKTDTIHTEEYWPNGNKRIQGGFESNKREGEWIYWFENGKVWSKGSFNKGLSNGKFDIYNEDGSRYMQSSYSNGKADGCWTFFEKDIKTKEVYFKNDSLVKQIVF